MKKINKLLILLLSTSLSACSGFFDKDNTPPPSPLVSFKPEARLNSLWYSSVDSGVGKDYLKLVPAENGSTIFTADRRGHVTATNKLNGKTLWNTNTKMSVTGGVGAGDNIAVIGGSEGDVTALSQTNGSVLWHTQTSDEVQAAPAIKNGMTLIKTIDGKITAYSNNDGHLVWTYQQVEPNLILRGASAPQIDRNYAVVGFANGNLIKLSLNGGNLLWQQTIAVPQGGFTIQRMVDIDADPLLFGNRVYAATYQGRISALDITTGQPIWTQDISSYTGIAADSSNAYVTDARSHVWAFSSDGGNVSWRQTQLEARNITGPALIGNYIVVGDAEGYLHVMSKQDGHFVARVKVNSSGIMASPIVSNNIIYVLTKDGHLAAYSLS